MRPPSPTCPHGRSRGNERTIGRRLAWQGLACLLAAGISPSQEPPTVDIARPATAACAQIRGGLGRARARFLDGTGRVVFLGGSITRMGADRDPGWANLVQADLQARFPDCAFRFANVGIPSIGSSGHAHRMQRDVFGDGIPDLLVVEAAVNDLHNGSSATTIDRAFEGVLRSAARRGVDVLVLHFADTAHLADYAAGQVPAVIAQHEAIAERYVVPSLDLARHIAEEIAAGRMDWRRDFAGNCHVPALGQRLYATQFGLFLDRLWGEAAAADGATPSRPRLPEPRSPGCYEEGRMPPLAGARDLNGARLLDAWTPNDGAGTRPGFVGVPVLEATGAGSGFAFEFRGTGAGLWLISGPDAARIRYRTDGSAWRELETRTRHSGRLHLPRPHVLAEGLAWGDHTLEVEVVARPAGEAGGHALRVVHLLEHGVEPLGESESGTGGKLDGKTR